MKFKELFNEDIVGNFRNEDNINRLMDMFIDVLEDKPFNYRFTMLNIILERYKNKQLNFDKYPSIKSMLDKALITRSKGIAVSSGLVFYLRDEWLKVKGDKT